MIYEHLFLHTILDRYRYIYLYPLTVVGKIDIYV